MNIKNLFTFFTSASNKEKITHILYNLLLGGLAIWVIFAHTYKLDNIPSGLFFDESTIGIDASNVSQTGFEKYGGEFQIFFQTEADSDSPILVYATALMFRLFSISEYNLRLVSAVFFIAAWLLAFGLVTKLFNGNRVIGIYLIIAFGFLPQFFTISRLAFEVIPQLTFTVAAIWGIWSTFHKEDLSHKIPVSAIFAGLMIGISTYTYSTANMLSTLMMVSIWVVYGNKLNLKKLFHLSAAYLIILIPYVIFNIIHPNALTSRFRNISFIFEPISLADKIKILFSNYIAYWSPSFLFLYGDTNLRHSTGISGSITITAGILFAVGLIAIVISIIKSWDRFKLFLLANLLFSPAAAALTSEGTPHTVRSLLLGCYIVLISCYGLTYLFNIINSWKRASLIAIIFVLLIYETISYQLDYFVHYPARSVDAFGSYDLKGALEFAIEENPKEIIVLDNFSGGLENLTFYKYVVHNTTDIPILTAGEFAPESGICIVYHRLSGDEEELDKSSIPYTEFRSRNRPDLWEAQLGAKPFSGMIKVRCY
ncbi:MAG: glycosyltransferase family 39 protein [Anaerolineales bacterium]|nr:glycosyltransferase family 39 protein [Anaerolineales bacterium]